jgi:hypothetical protein
MMYVRARARARARAHARARARGMCNVEFAMWNFLT